MAKSKKVVRPYRIVRKRKAGMKIVDIAVAIGYPRGSGQNYVRNILAKYGVE
jgi:hypothetical protein